jgi:hypothetical protein
MPSRNLNEFGAQHSLEFDINPFISEIVLWNDAEILDAHRHFARMPKSHRVALICERLFTNDVAVVEYMAEGHLASN